jgi:hypothetical protein
VFEGVGMTKKQVDDYKANIEKLFAFDWDGVAIEKYKTEMTAFNDRVRDLEWIRMHPVEAWFRDTFAPIGIDIMDFVCKAAPLVLIVISFTLSPLAGAAASAAFAAIEGTWTTLAPPGSAFHSDDQPTGWDAFEIISEHIALQVGSDIAGQIAAPIFEALVSVALRGAAALSVKIGAAFKNLPEELGSASKLILASEKFLIEDTKYIGYVKALEKNVEELAAFNAEIGPDLEANYARFVAQKEGAGTGLLDVVHESDALFEAVYTANKGFLQVQEELVAYLAKLEKDGHGLAGILPRLKGAEADFQAAKNAFTNAAAARDALSIGSPEWDAAFEISAKLGKEMSKAGEQLLTESRYASAMAYLAQDSMAFMENFTAENILLFGVAKLVSQLHSNTVGKTIHNWVKDGIVSLYGFEEVAESWGSLIQFLTHKHVQAAVMAQPVPTAGEDYPVLDTNVALPKLQILMQRIRVDYLTPYVNAYARHMIMLKTMDDENKRHDDQDRKNNNSPEAGDNGEFEKHKKIANTINVALVVTEAQLWDTLYAYFDQINKVFSEYPDDSEIIGQLTDISNNTPVRPPPDPGPEPPPPPPPPPTSHSGECEGNYIEIHPSKPSVEFGEPVTFFINLHYEPLYKSNAEVHWMLDDQDGIRIGDTGREGPLNITFEKVFKGYGIKPGKLIIWANAVTDNYDETCNSLWAWTEIEIKEPIIPPIIVREPTARCKANPDKYVLIETRSLAFPANSPMKFVARLNGYGPTVNSGYRWFLDEKKQNTGGFRNDEREITLYSSAVGRHWVRVEYWLPNDDPCDILDDKMEFEVI